MKSANDDGETASNLVASLLTMTTMKTTALLMMTLCFMMGETAEAAFGPMHSGMANAGQRAVISTMSSSSKKSVRRDVINNDHHGAFRMIGREHGIREGGMRCTNYHHTTTATTLFMSDYFPEESSNSKPSGGSTKSSSSSSTSTSKQQNWLQQLQQYGKDRLPPSPEDQFTMIGDIGSIFVYACSSHTLNNMIVSHVVETSETLQDAIQALDPMHEVIKNPDHLPVWLFNQPEYIQQQYLLNEVQTKLMDHYSPILSSIGTSFIALCGCWLVSGYIHQSFCFHNTLDCKTSHVLLKTLQTWITCITICLGFVVGCNFLFGGAASDNTDIIRTMTMLVTNNGGSGGMDIDSMMAILLPTQTDMMYIIDSLSVLVVWRFMLSVMLGYGK
mmetsp:Transcript_13948/g.39703  ORF Transcript_13948/g.39703 Transcript_13948/m.39703 type:complete len:388 (-) Transcript_13948:185-1348(-)